MSQTMSQFGELVFNSEIMKNRLSQSVYDQLMATMTKGEPLAKEIAGEVAHSMKEWAIEQGATHYTHWFQPLRGGTAEKHYAFIGYDERGEVLERLSAQQLIQSEPDASSFPSGGMRSTFEARGYSSWDSTSPVFLMEGECSKTLVIPSIFMSWTGEVLDQKTGLLRSKKILNQMGIKLQKHLGNRNAKHLHIQVGIEQEYFLVDKALFQTRPDLKTCKRTLFGADPAKGQQLKDHYFGAIKPRVLHFMEELDQELYRRGIPAKARHNEVTPNQFEVTPLHEELNLAVDHNLILMNLIEKVADSHDLVAVLHEKPYRGVNGSGKHVNWSINDNTGVNYLEPSASPLRNITLLITVAAIMTGVGKYGGLLRALVSDAGNDERLGQGEAPPNIMSVFLGDYLTKILAEVEQTDRFTEQKITQISLGIRQLPAVVKDMADRNRTSPIAFTGNKFEFRMAGSSQNCSELLTLINMMVAEGYEQIYDRIAPLKGDPKKNALIALRDILPVAYTAQHEGNCYEASWEKEARKRGLASIDQTPDALSFYTATEIQTLFDRYQIYSARELEARQLIKMQTYQMTRLVECRVAVEMVQKQVLPALLKYLGQLEQAGTDIEDIRQERMQVAVLYSDLRQKMIQFKAAVENTKGETLTNAKKVQTLAINEMNRLRELVDRAEELIPFEFWPMATYQQLFELL